VRTATWQGTHQSAQSPFHSMSCSAFSSPNLSNFSFLVFECLFMMSSMSNMFMCNALSLLCIADDMLRNHKQNGDSDVSSSIDAVSWNSDSHCCKRERTLRTPWTVRKFACSECQCKLIFGRQVARCATFAAIGPYAREEKRCKMQRSDKWFPCQVDETHLTWTRLGLFALPLFRRVCASIPAVARCGGGVGSGNCFDLPTGRDTGVFRSLV